MLLKRLLEYLIVLAILLAIYIAFIVFETGRVDFYETSTALLDESARFTGIVDFEKKTTHLVIVHGIGNHCIGYADSMISGMNRLLKAVDWHGSAHAGYARYLKKMVEGIAEAEVDEGARIYPPRTGSCEIDESDTDSIDLLRALSKKDRTLVDKADELNSTSRIINRIDMEAVVLGQEALCDSIHQSADYDTGTYVDCHRLYVNKKSSLLEIDGQNPEYITGFVRRIVSRLHADRELRIYEVTWSPATRWLKTSFLKAERINEEASNFWANRSLKSDIVNTAIADAVAYLSDGGILVNHDVMQAFCLVLGNASNVAPNNQFSCDRQFLESTTDEFSKNNDVALISHSLGTRVVLDTLGLLSRGLASDEQSKGDDPDLVQFVKARFDTIGAEVPEQYTNPTENHAQRYSSLLAGRISEFIKAIRSIYVFTNQIPLLSADITSPLKPREHRVSRGFAKFLETRSEIGPLQVVAFHDPDDLLSYDLKCWFHLNITKNLDSTKMFIDNQARERSNNSGKNFYSERTSLFNSLFGTCSEKSLEVVDDQLLFSELWNRQKGLNLVDARVRLKTFNVPLLFANPTGIHSNYFEDELVHRWLVKGH